MTSGLESFLTGYEEGLKEAYNEVIRLCVKGHTPREIQILIKSHLASMHTKLDTKLRELKKTGEYLETITDAPAPVVQPQLAPAPQPVARAPPDIERGGSYIVEEDDDENSFRIFTGLLGNGSRGLCIVRKYPDNVKEKYNIGDSQIVWLTQSEEYITTSITQALPLAGLGADMSSDEMEGQLGIAPTNLSGLQSAIKGFLKENGSDSIIILQGVEYLITQNKFNSVLKFLNAIHDDIAFKRASMIMPVNPEAIEDENKYKLLERAIGNTIKA